MSLHYSNLKPLRFPDHLAALKNRTLAAPVHIRIKPINRCNHDCWYCAYRVSNLQLGEDMDTRDVIPTDKMFEIVDDILEMGVKAVTFSGGGEPLLYKPLPEVVERLGKGGVKVAALTNGSNLKGRMADVFAEYGTWVRVSLDGWDDTSYAKARGVREGEFSRIIRNMRDFLARSSDCVLGACVIIGHDNAPHIAETCVLMKDVGVHHVKLSGVVIANDVKDNNIYHRKIQPVVAEQIAEARTLEDENFKILDYYHELEERFEKQYTLCPFLQFLTVIGADCRVYTCQDKAFTEAGCLGSIADRRFKDFWFSEENREKIYAFDPSKLCKHHCVTHGKNLMLHEYLSLDPEHGCFV